MFLFKLLISALSFFSFLYWLDLDFPFPKSWWEVGMCLFKTLLYLNVMSHFGHFFSSLAGFGLCFIMCLFSFDDFVAMKSQRVQCKSFRNTVDVKIPTWPSIVFTTCISTLWTDEMCFSKKNALFNVLSQMLHWISQLLFVLWTFKLATVLKAAGQLSHLIAFLSPTHFVMWLLLLLYGIVFSQCLQVNSLWESMCVFSFLLPLHVTSHFSQMSSRSSCFALMCILRCLSEGASMLHMAQEGMVTANSFCWQ